MYPLFYDPGKYGIEWHAGFFLKVNKKHKKSYPYHVRIAEYLILQSDYPQIRIAVMIARAMIV